MKNQGDYSQFRLCHKPLWNLASNSGKLMYFFRQIRSEFTLANNSVKLQCQNKIQNLEFIKNRQIAVEIIKSYTCIYF